MNIADTVNVRDYIKKMKKRDKELNTYWGTNCPPFTDEEYFEVSENIGQLKLPAPDIKN